MDSLNMAERLRVSTASLSPLLWLEGLDGERRVDGQEGSLVFGDGNVMEGGRRGKEDGKGAGGNVMEGDSLMHDPEKDRGRSPEYESHPLQQPLEALRMATSASGRPSSPPAPTNSTFGRKPGTMSVLQSVLSHHHTLLLLLGVGVGLALSMIGMVTLLSLGERPIEVSACRSAYGLHTYTYPHTHTPARTYTHTATFCLHTYAHTSPLAHTQAHTQTHTYTRTPAHGHTQILTFTQSYTHMHAHIPLHTLIPTP